MNNIVKGFVVVMVCVGMAGCVKPKQKGLVPGTAGDFKTSGLEEIMSYSDFNRDGK